MRMTIVAGLIVGLALAVQSMVDARARAKVINGGGVHEREIAPWYVATNGRPTKAVADARSIRSL
jgi:hypothetical protein